MESWESDQNSKDTFISITENSDRANNDFSPTPKGVHTDADLPAEYRPKHSNTPSRGVSSPLSSNASANLSSSNPFLYDTEILAPAVLQSPSNPFRATSPTTNPFSPANQHSNPYNTTNPFAADLLSSEPAIKATSNSNVSLSNPFLTKSDMTTSEQHLDSKESSRDQVGSPENDTMEYVYLNRLPGENLGMVMGIEGDQENRRPIESVVVKSITPGGAAARACQAGHSILVGDHIKEVDGRPLTELTHDECIALLADMPEKVILTVSRASATETSQMPDDTVDQNLLAAASKRKTSRGPPPVPPPRKYFKDTADGSWVATEDASYREEGEVTPRGFLKLDVTVFREAGDSLGLSIVPSYGATCDLYQVKRLLPEGACARSGHLEEGDRLLFCNGLSLRALTQAQCLHVLKSSGHVTELIILRQAEGEQDADVQDNKDLVTPNENLLGGVEFGYGSERAAEVTDSNSELVQSLLDPKFPSNQEEVRWDVDKARDIDNTTEVNLLNQNNDDVFFSLGSSEVDSAPIPPPSEFGDLSINFQQATPESDRSDCVTYIDDLLGPVKDSDDYAETAAENTYTPPSDSTQDSLLIDFGDSSTVEESSGPQDPSYNFLNDNEFSGRTLEEFAEECFNSIVSDSEKLSNSQSSGGGYFEENPPQSLLESDKVETSQAAHVTLVPVSPSSPSKHVTYIPVSSPPSSAAQQSSTSPSVGSSEPEKSESVQKFHSTNISVNAAGTASVTTINVTARRNNDTKGRSLPPTPTTQPNPSGVIFSTDSGNLATIRVDSQPVLETAMSDQAPFPPATTESASLAPPPAFEGPPSDESSTPPLPDSAPPPIPNGPPPDLPSPSTDQNCLTNATLDQSSYQKTAVKAATQGQVLTTQGVITNGQEEDEVIEPMQASKDAQGKVLCMPASMEQRGPPAVRSIDDVAKHDLANVLASLVDKSPNKAPTVAAAPVHLAKVEGEGISEPEIVPTVLSRDQKEMARDVLNVWGGQPEQSSTQNSEQPQSSKKPSPFQRAVTEVFQKVPDNAVAHTTLGVSNSGQDADDTIQPMSVTRDALGKTFCVPSSADTQRPAVKPRTLNNDAKLELAKVLGSFSTPAPDLSVRKPVRQVSAEEKGMEDEIVPTVLNRDQKEMVTNVLGSWSNVDPQQKTTTSVFQKAVSGFINSQSRDEDLADVTSKNIDSDQTDSVENENTTKDSTLGNIESVAKRVTENDLVASVVEQVHASPVFIQPVQTTASVDKEKADESSLISVQKSEEIVSSEVKIVAPLTNDLQEKLDAPVTARLVNVTKNIVDVQQKTENLPSAVQEKETSIIVSEEGPHSPVSIEAKQGLQSPVAENAPKKVLSAVNIFEKAANDQVASPSTEPQGVVLRSKAKQSSDFRAKINSFQSQPNPVLASRRPQSMIEVSPGSSSLRMEDLKKSFTTDHAHGSYTARPLTTIKPLSASTARLDRGGTRLSSVTVSRTSGSVTNSALAPRAPRVEYPKGRRVEGSPFQVDILKGIVGLGAKVKVTPEGLAQVTEIQRNGSIDKNGNVKVGDYLLWVNTSELTGQTESRVQQVLRLLPRGLVKLVVSSTPPDQKPQDSSSDTPPAQYGLRLSPKPFGQPDNRAVSPTSDAQAVTSLDNGGQQSFVVTSEVERSGELCLPIFTSAEPTPTQSTPPQPLTARIEISQGSQNGAGPVKIAIKPSPAPRPTHDIVKPTVLPRQHAYASSTNESLDSSSADSTPRDASSSQRVSVQRVEVVSSVTEQSRSPAGAEKGDQPHLRAFESSRGVFENKSIETEPTSPSAVSPKPTSPPVVAPKPKPQSLSSPQSTIKPSPTSPTVSESSAGDAEVSSVMLSANIGDGRSETASEVKHVEEGDEVLVEVAQPVQSSPIQKVPPPVAPKPRRSSSSSSKSEETVENEEVPPVKNTPRISAGYERLQAINKTTKPSKIIEKSRTFVTSKAKLFDNKANDSETDPPAKQPPPQRRISVGFNTSQGEGARPINSSLLPLKERRKSTGAPSNVQLSHPAPLLSSSSLSKPRPLSVSSNRPRELPIPESVSPRDGDHEGKTKVLSPTRLNSALSPRHSSSSESPTSPPFSPSPRQAPKVSEESKRTRTFDGKGKVTEIAGTFRSSPVTEHSGTFRSSPVTEHSGTFRSTTVTEHSGTFRSTPVTEYSGTFRSTPITVHEHTSLSPVSPKPEPTPSLAKHSQAVTTKSGTQSFPAPSPLASSRTSSLSSQLSEEVVEDAMKKFDDLLLDAPYTGVETDPSDLLLWAPVRKDTSVGKAAPAETGDASQDIRGTGLAKHVSSSTSSQHEVKDVSKVSMELAKVNGSSSEALDQDTVENSKIPEKEDCQNKEAVCEYEKNKANAPVAAPRRKPEPTEITQTNVEQVLTPSTNETVEKSQISKAISVPVDVAEESQPENAERAEQQTTTEMSLQGQESVTGGQIYVLTDLNIVSNNVSKSLDNDNKNQEKLNVQLSSNVQSTVVDQAKEKENGIEEKLESAIQESESDQSQANVEDNIIAKNIASVMNPPPSDIYQSQALKIVEDVMAKIASDPSLLSSEVKHPVPEPTSPTSSEDEAPPLPGAPPPPLILRDTNLLVTDKSWLDDDQVVTEPAAKVEEKDEKVPDVQDMIADQQVVSAVGVQNLPSPRDVTQLDANESSPEICDIIKTAPVYEEVESPSRADSAEPLNSTGDSLREGEAGRARSPSPVDMLSEDSGMPGDEEFPEVHTDDAISPPGELAEAVSQNITQEAETTPQISLQKDVALTEEAPVALDDVTMSISTESKAGPELLLLTNEDQIEKLPELDQENTPEQKGEDENAVPPVLPSSLPPCVTSMQVDVNVTSLDVDNQVSISPPQVSDSQLSSQDLTSSGEMPGLTSGVQENEAVEIQRYVSVDVQNLIRQDSATIVSNVSNSVDSGIVSPTDSAQGTLEKIDSISKTSDDAPSQNPSATEDATSLTSSRSWSLYSNTCQGPVAKGSAGEPMTLTHNSNWLSTAGLITLVDRANVTLGQMTAPEALELLILHLHREEESTGLGIDLRHSDGHWYKVSSIRKDSPAALQGSLQTGDWLLAIDSLWCDGVTSVMRLMGRLTKPKHDSLLVVARGERPGLADTTDPQRPTPVPRPRSVVKNSSPAETTEPSGVAVEEKTEAKAAPEESSSSLKSSAEDCDSTPPTLPTTAPPPPSAASTVPSPPPSLANPTDTAVKADSKPPAASTVSTAADTTTATPAAAPSDLPAGVQKVIMLKGATGVGFCLEGGLGSPKGNLPIAIKRIFKD
ncbi:uncharacterized threonine-rich GPI-anchored glycoprotein PJ4664.02 isoform X2 [Aplysia californica]|uniref:Uncharacterized threonine-rich GPI-anchored glycoprotein PJ4664.02 isoform X2 n=1 Tax=Aplysia californica TaxID=6500 RepID=A0ABM1VPT4_APLCA|nr:uncharacterized threonine-rich GPI-anchored glycoprotein PJ4664.02 isoform X2 [Aplysia californica]